MESWPLVGREPELDAIQSALFGDRPGGVVLVGAPGVGKTRLARVAVDRWAAAGGDREWLVATRAAATIPFGATFPLLLGEGSDPRDQAQGTDAENPATLLARVTDRFTARARSRPVLVAVDDAHLLDDASAALLLQLSVGGLVVPLVTLRSREPVSDAVQALWKDTARRVPVPPLGAAAIDALLGQALGGRLDALTRRRLHGYTDGNPLLLRELLADALESGVLVRREGLWRWTGEVPAGGRVGELVTAQLSTLDTPVREVLELIACGEPLAVSVLERLADSAAIEAAERTGLAVAQRSGARIALRLTHPLYGEVLRAALPVSRARSLWGRLASVLADGPSRRRDDALLAAVWQLESGAVGDAATLLDAARQAMSRFELALAERLARAARSAGGGEHADLLLAQLLCWRGRGREAVPVLPAAPPAGHRPLWAVTRADILYWGLGRPRDAERVLDEVPPAAPGADLADASRSWILFFDGRCRSALSVAERVLKRDGADEQAVVWAAMSGAAAAGVLGLLDQARAIAAQGRAAAGTDRLPWAQAQLGYGLCLALRAAGAVDELDRLAEAGYRAAVQSGASMSTAIWAAWRGGVAVARGRLADAQAELREAVALLEVDDSYHLARVCIAEWATAVALSGEQQTAQALLARADSPTVPGVNRVFEPQLALARAWVEAAGSPATGARSARRAAVLARETEQPTVEAACLFDAARLGAAGAVYERLATLANLASRNSGQITEAYARAARGLALAEPGELVMAATLFARHGHLVLAAEAEAAAAQAHARAGRAVMARAARERCAVLAADFQGVRTPLLEDAGTGTVLTRREREVAVLALTRTSRQIADQLGLSVNTVNNTLARAFGKLSVSNRRQLAEALGMAVRGSA
jgi:DNA-binding CsgD family transcriptional regulator